MLHGKEYTWEISEMGEQVWYRISARVAAGRGKWEASFAKVIWVGKRVGRRSPRDRPRARRAEGRGRAADAGGV
eukprot:9163487-Pyramimonas_sp.AAC.1